MASVSGSPALVLFDIDGTLMRRSGPHHREALVAAVQAVTGLTTTTDNIPVQGMLDRDILSWMLRDAGSADPQIEAWMPALVQRAQWIYARRCPQDLRDKLCPGVEGLLEQIRSRRFRTGLVTGNLTRIGWKKVERARIKRYFHFGAFAEKGRTRGELVKLALEHAHSMGWMNSKTVCSLIGDHPNDIRAAQQNGIRSIGVATGLSSRAELLDHKPDLVVDTLEGLNADYFLERV